MCNHMITNEEAAVVARQLQAEATRLTTLSWKIDNALRNARLARAGTGITHRYLMSVAEADAEVQRVVQSIRNDRRIIR